jgi:hypothetical protein
MRVHQLISLRISIRPAASSQQDQVFVIILHAVIGLLI